MTSPIPEASPVAWLSVVPAILAGLIFFDALFAVGAALDWAVTGLYDLPQSVSLAVGIAVAIFSLGVAFKFSLKAYRADQELS